MTATGSKGLVRRWLFSIAVPLLSWFASGARAEPAASDEILWDTWGVPHIYARTREGACERLGWAQMRAHADLIARLYGAARGRGAAHWGKHAFEEDALIHTLRIPERAEQWLEAQSAEARRCLDAFTRGLNAYATAYPEAVRRENRWTLPFQNVDVLAHVQHVLFGRFLFSDAEEVLAFHARSGSPPERRPAKAHGSNAYAIAKTRSASRESLLVINPHLPWSGELTLFEAQIVQGEHSFYGAALVGQPYLSMGFSADGGWAHTVNAFDGLDTYELTLRDGGYLFDGEVRAFEQITPAEIGVRSPGGKVTTRALPRLASVHGPVVAIDAKAGKALAVRFAGLDASDLLERYWALAEARTVGEFEAISNRHRLPFFNTLYASRRGDVLFRYEGLMPRRTGGDYASWHGLQDGRGSANLWTSYYGVESLPRLLNPAGGFVQNANDPPWFASYPGKLDPAQYPPYIASAQLDFRAQQSIRMVAEDSSISFDELVTYKQSNHVELADRVLPALLEGIEGQPVFRAAHRVLSGWDRTLASDARGAVLFIAWVELMGGADATWYAEPWSEREPLTTPRGIASLEKARRALRRACDRIKARYGRIDVPYGDVYRLRLGSHDLPASTGPVAYGLYSAAEFSPAEDGRQVAWGGDTFVAVVAFGKQPRALGLLAYGNASQPDSAHVGDQLSLFSERRLRPLWLTRAEVEQNLEKRE